MIFVADENFQYRAIRLLEAFDRAHEIRSVRDVFGAGTPDLVWMRRAKEEWGTPVALCGDGRILRNKAEKAVLKECDLMFVHLAPGWTNLPWAEFAWKIIKAWPAIVQNVTNARRPTIFEVSASTLKVEHRGLVADWR